MDYKIELGNGLDRLRICPDKGVDLIFAGLWNPITREDMQAIVSQSTRVARKAVVLQPVTDSHASRLFCWFEDAGFKPRIEVGIKIQNTLTTNAPLRSTQPIVVVPISPKDRNEIELDFNRPYSQHIDKVGARTGNDITPNLPSAHRDNPEGTRRLRTFFPMPAPRKSRTADQPSQDITIAARFINEWTNVGDTVLDFSCGSGTTGEASRRLYRNFLGIDIDSIKVTMSRSRLEMVQPKSLKHEMAELNRQIVNAYARVKKWAPETL